MVGGVVTGAVKLVEGIFVEAGRVEEFFVEEAVMLVLCHDGVQGGNK